MMQALSDPVPSQTHQSPLLPLGRKTLNPLLNHPNHIGVQPRVGIQLSGVSETLEDRGDRCLGIDGRRGPGRDDLCDGILDDYSGDLAGGFVEVAAESQYYETRAGVGVLGGREET